jgi:hypothetical protein
MRWEKEGDSGVEEERRTARVAVAVAGILEIQAIKNRALIFLFLFSSRKKEK